MNISPGYSIQFFCMLYMFFKLHYDNYSKVPVKKPPFTNMKEGSIGV